MAQATILIISICTRLSMDQVQWRIGRDIPQTKQVKYPKRRQKSILLPVTHLDNNGKSFPRYSLQNFWNTDRRRNFEGSVP